jgi:NAD(P)-dependent dehydrogenase (short-subunit alcohol dehydrogenase family)
VHFCTNAESADRVAQEVTRCGGRALTLQADISSSREVARAIGVVIAEWGRLDILVCNAGVLSRSFITETTDEEFDRTFAVNVKGTFNCIRAVLPIMAEQGTGRIITISSHNAKRGTGPSSKATYAATKNAVESYTRGAAVEAAPFNVTVNCVSPGWIPPGELPRPLSDLHETLLAGIPLGRPGLASEVAAAVGFLASDEAAYITGETLDLNGGTWMD